MRAQFPNGSTLGLWLGVPARAGPALLSGAAVAAARQMLRIDLLRLWPTTLANSERRLAGSWVAELQGALAALEDPQGPHAR